MTDLRAWIGWIVAIGIPLAVIIFFGQ